VDLALFSCACGLAAAQLLRLHVPHVFLVIAFVGLCVLWYWMSARRTRAIKFFKWLRRPILLRTDDPEFPSESDQRVNTELS
jgi:UDP-GlcNAc:undecaprenyl-phosphate GlcNAc-1-phosphate transferase